MKSKSIRWAIRILILIALSFFVYFSYFYSKVHVGDKIPEFDLMSITQKSVKAGDLLGKTYMLHFFSRECGICMKELPFLIKFSHDNKNKMFVLFVHEGAGMDDLAALSQIFGGKIDPDNVFIDDWHAAEDFGVSMVPTTFIIGADGMVIKKIVGQDEEEIVKSSDKK